MIAIPWFLLALGIILVIVGFLLAGLSAASPKRPRRITEKMRDKEIIQHLRDEQRISMPAVVIGVGMGCILVSFGWRLVRRVLRYMAR
jgi:hypothetical protein